MRFHRSSSIEARLTRIEQIMTQQTTDEQHLAADVAALSAAVATEVAELKAAIAAGATPAALDFTALDNLVASTQAGAAADAPPAPPAPPVAPPAA